MMALGSTRSSSSIVHGHIFFLLKVALFTSTGSPGRQDTKQWDHSEFWAHSPVRTVSSEVLVAVMARGWDGSDISKFGGMRIYSWCAANNVLGLPGNCSLVSPPPPHQLDLPTGPLFTCKHTHTHTHTHTRVRAHTMLQLLPGKIRSRHTWKRDVEALIGNGKVWYKPKLGCEVSKQTRLDGVRQHRAREPGHRLREAPVLGDQQVVVGTLQMKGVEDHLDSWETEMESVRAFYTFNMELQN